MYESNMLNMYESKQILTVRKIVFNSLLMECKNPIKAIYMSTRNVVLSISCELNI